MPSKTKCRPPEPAHASAGFPDQLRHLIDRRGLSSYAVAQASGIAPAVVSRFMAGKRGLTLETFDRIAGALGLRLVELARGQRRPGPSPGARPGRLGNSNSPPDPEGPDA